jgi:putative ABC transport system substrate-binding protein
MRGMSEIARDEKARIDSTRSLTLCQDSPAQPALDVIAFLPWRREALGLGGHMKRREFITLIGGAAASWPLAARAQQPGQPRRIAVLMGSAATELGKTYLATFLRRLEQLGWIEGRNARTEVRWWTGGPEQMRPLVAELLAFSPDVIMVFSNLGLALLKPMAGNVPVVFVGVGDPVGGGFVASLARPGANITGFAGTEAPMAGKWFEVLKETAPRVIRVMAIIHPETPAHQAMWRAIKESAPRLGVEAISGGVHDASEIESAMSSFAAYENGGIVVLPHAITWANENLIIALALRHRLPAVFATDVSVKAGGLVSYGLDWEHSFRQTAEYVDRILRGERPGDLPVQLPTKYKLVFNLKTANAIGLDIPSILLTRADEVIE